MTVLFELLGNVLTAIEPRNERARTWLDELIFRCYESSKQELNPLGYQATVHALKFDYHTVRIIQGRDIAQKQLYEQADHLLTQLEMAADDRSMAKQNH